KSTRCTRVPGERKMRYSAEYEHPGDEHCDGYSSGRGSDDCQSAGDNHEDTKPNCPPQGFLRYGADGGSTHNRSFQRLSCFAKGSSFKRPSQLKSYRDYGTMLAPVLGLERLRPLPQELAKTIRLQPLQSSCSTGTRT